MRLAGSAMRDYASHMIPEDREWLNGKEFAAFLRRRAVVDGERLTQPNSQLGPSWGRRFFAWENEGARVSVWQADRLLLEIGLHLTDLPEDLYCDPPPRGQPGHRKVAA